jgi:hypothetical protein
MWHVDCLNDVKDGALRRVVKRIDTMDTIAPEIFQYWLAAPVTNPDETNVGRDDESRAQQAALEDLAGRVSAARSVV